MKQLLVPYVVAMLLLLAAPSAYAAATTAGMSVSRGDSDSMAYSLHVGQSYDPWFANSLCELVPTMEIGAHAWVDDDDDVDTVWGAYAAPGLRFTLVTSGVFQPYLAGSLGGVVNSERRIDERDLGSHALFRSKGSVGIEFGEELHHRIQGDYTRYSNFGLADTDDGYDTYGISYGYSF